MKIALGGELIQKEAIASSHGLRDLFEIVSKAKRHWEATFDAIVDPVLIVSADFKVIRANLAAAEAAQMKVRDLVTKTCFKAFAKIDGPCKNCPLVKSQDSLTHERKSLEPFYDQREYIASAFPIIRDGVHEAEAFVLQYQDRSTIRQLKEQLIQSEKMAALGLFASGVAHDINNPLSGILAFAQIAKNKVSVHDKVFEDLQEIENGARRCKKIIKDLLALNRPISPHDRSHISLEDLIQKILPNLKVQWQHQKPRIQVHLKTTTPVWVHETQMDQVFSNLLMNAFQAIGPEGTIVIRNGEDLKKIYIEISDDGRGISPETLQKIFDPYFTTKAKQGGTGLGLPICYRIIQEHGGNLKVKTEMGKGTTMKVEIPKERINESTYSSR